MKTSKLTTLFLLICGITNGQEPEHESNAVPHSFRHLKSFESFNDYSFSGSPYPDTKINFYMKPKIYFDPATTEIINKPVDSTQILFTTHPDYFKDLTRPHELIRTRITKSKEDIYYVFFDYGMSIDPNYKFFKLKNDSLFFLFGLPGLELYIPGNGCLYVEGHTNNYFNERKKFRFVDETIIEVKQPFQYVGLKTKTNGVLELFSDKELKDLVAIVPPDNEIEVLLNENEYYLIKTSFGLVGWWKFDGLIHSDIFSKAINEIYYLGD